MSVTKNNAILFAILLFCTSLYSQGNALTDTVYIDTYKMPKELVPNDLVEEIKLFLRNRNYQIIEDSPIKTDERKDVFEKNNASWFARNIFGRKNLQEYPFLIKHTLTFDQNKNGRYYVVIFSFAELESKSLPEDIVQEIQEDAMKSAEKMAKREFDDLKKEIIKKKSNARAKNKDQ